MKYILMGTLGFGLLVAGTSVAHINSAQDSDEQLQALPVRTTTVQIENGYFARRSFTGRAISGRISNMAFELGGTLKSVSVDIGTPVKAGEAVAKLDTDRLSANKRQLVAERDEVASNLALAERTLKRVQETHSKGHASAQRLDEAEANAISLRARQERLNASIAAVDIDLAKAHIIAPYSGVITQRFLDEGSVVAAGTPIVEITETSRMEGHIGMPPAHAEAIKNGSEFLLFNGKRMRIKGAALRSVVPVIAGETRTMMVTFNLPAEQVSRGEIINAVVKNWHEQTGAWLPLRALSADVRGMWRVYKVDQSTNPAHVEFENVQILYSESDRAFVSGTISNGDIIIADGVARLAPGQQVSLLANDPAS